MVEQTSPDIPNGIRIAVVDLPKSPESSSSTTKTTKKGQNDPEEKETGDTPQQYTTMFIAELLGTGLLMFLGCLGCVTNFDEPAPSHYFGSITFGLTVMLIIQTFGHISGAHLNPAVTIATVLLGILKPAMGVVYILAQFVGATLGYGLLKILVSDKYAPEGFCVTSVNDHLTSVQGLGIELVITTVLILICCAVWDKRNEAKQDSVPLRFGFSIAAISMATGPLTGASMNTARSFAPLVFGGNWGNHWIYWVGPNAAALVGCGLYKFLFGLPPEEEESKREREQMFLNDMPQHSGEKV